MNGEQQISIRLIRWTAGYGAVQINAVCPLCHCTMQTLNLYELAQWMQQHNCPEILPIEHLVIEGNLDLVTLQEALKL